MLKLLAYNARDEVFEVTNCDLLKRNIVVHDAPCMVKHGAILSVTYV